MNSSSSFNFSVCKFSKKRNSESTYSSRNRLTFADSAYKFSEFHLQCEFRLHFVESLYSCKLFSLVAEFATQQMCQQKYATCFCTRNPRKLCQWSSITFWNTFKDFFMESNDKQTQNCAPIQCTV